MSDRKIPDKKGYFGDFGGRYVPEVLVTALDELEQIYNEAQKDSSFFTAVQLSIS